MNPATPHIDLITTDGYLYLNAEFKSLNLMASLFIIASPKVTILFVSPAPFLLSKWHIKLLLKP
ncbi:hypothetical protein HQ29_09075 [Porphyromonas canoris]|uniref:Uncharacterized protein n=2 Tax=Porphyromonadaceae TaxID=171551 RepID=A0ABR4XMZ0_9PORP|nr:hypothetical protein [Porphyromonas canoris]KGL51133.1 hypothetical protein HQ29_09075 [Porphyromonas canoris]KGN93568.1 hypothetical protein HQ43_00010 [Porphyromonas canoris]KGN94470.1 hypothetical protein HQ39_09105 [Porphyromonas sp. COT-108 OH2963]